MNMLLILGGLLLLSTLKPKQAVAEEAPEKFKLRIPGIKLPTPPISPAMIADKTKWRRGPQCPPGHRMFQPPMPKARPGMAQRMVMPPPYCAPEIGVYQTERCPRGWRKVSVGSRSERCIPE